MRVAIDLHRRDFATVVYTPSPIDRFIGRRSREHCAFFNGRVWCWLTGAEIRDLRVLRALTEALRDLIVARATAPPLLS